MIRHSEEFRPEAMRIALTSGAVAAARGVRFGGRPFDAGQVGVGVSAR